MGHKAKTVAAHYVFLDNQNPRHERIDNEAAIIQRLLGMENVKKLASDIATYGLSPLDRIAVIPHVTQKGRYTVAEGNRRLCAIKLLTDPEKASSETVRGAFRELRNRMSAPIRDLDVIVFDDRAAARHWLELRHEGPQGGAGTKPWNPAQKARFNADGKGDNPNTLALDLLDYASSRHLITPQQREKLNLTTLTRFLSNPVFRNALGLASNRQIEIRALQRDFDRALCRFLIDSLKPTSEVNSRTDKKQREAYANRLRAEGVSPLTQQGDPISLDPKTGKAPVGSPLASPARKSRDNRSPRDRAHVVPSDFVCQIHDRILKRIYDELKSIDTADFPFAATYLFRALIEIATRRYCTKHGLPYRDLHAALGKVEEHLQAQGVPAGELKALRVMAQSRDSTCSPETLGNTLHGGSVANKRHLNDGWDSVAPALLHMFHQLLA